MKRRLTRWETTRDVAGTGIQASIQACLRVVAIFAIGVSTAFADEIQRESFEGGAPNYDTGLISAPDAFFLGQGDFWFATDGSNIVSASSAGGVPPAAYSGQDGNRYWAGQDLDAQDDGTDTVEFGPIPISGFTNLQFSGLFAADGLLGGSPASPRYDPGEGLEVAWSIDGGAFTTALAFKSELTAGNNGNLRLDTDLDGVGEGAILGTIFSSHSFPIGITGANLTIRVTGISSGSQEEFAFDNLTVSGDPSVTNQAPTVSAVGAPDVGEAGIGLTAYTFTVTYSDDSGIDPATIDAADVTVSGIAMSSGTTSDPAGSPLTATYTFTPPGGSWDAGDNGIYKIVVSANEVGDDDGTQLFVPAGDVDFFSVMATNTVPSVFSVRAPPVTHLQFGATSYSFEVTYVDAGGIDATSIGSSDVTVTGPSGGLTVTGGTTSDSSGSTVKATYTVTAPGGSWEATDDGTYTIGIEASEILDLAGEPVPANASQATFFADSTCVVFESFEADGPAYDTGLVTAPEAFFLTNADFWTVTDGTGILSASSTGGVPPAAYTGPSGNRYWAGQDLDAQDDGTDTVELGPIPIAGFTDLKFGGLFAADGLLGGDPGSPRYDAGEGLEVAWSIDGSPFTTGLAFKSELAAGNNGNLREDTDLDGVGDGAILGPAFDSHSFAIGSTGVNLTLRVTGIANGSQEEFAFDGLKVVGTPSTVNQAPTVSSVNAPDVGEVGIGQTTYTFTVTYSDDSGIDPATIDAADVTVNGMAVSAGTTSDPAGAPLTATYTFKPPGGFWDAADTGTYKIAVMAGEVGDDDGTPLFVPAGDIGSFLVMTMNTPPEVLSVRAPPITHPQLGETSYSFEVTYKDLGGIDVSSIGVDDVKVTGPGGAMTVTAGSTSDPDGPLVTATYTVTAPGGSWDASDDGTYTIGIGGSEVLDLAGEPVPGNASQASFFADSTCAIFESFEAEGPEFDTGLVTAPEAFFLSESDFWTATDGSVIVSGSSVGAMPPAAYTSPDGRVYWAGQDLDAQDDGTDMLELGPIPIAGFTGLEFRGLFAADGLLGGDAGSPRYDPGEGLEVAWSVDGGPFVTALAFKSELMSGNNSNLREDTDLDGVGDGAILGTAFTTSGFAIGSIGSSLMIRVTGISNGSQEEFAFDGLKVLGVPPPPEMDVQRPVGTSITDGGTDALGSQAIGSPLTFIYTIDNTAGLGVLTIPAGGVAAANLGNVSGFGSGTPLPLVVPAGATRELMVQFQVDAKGAFALDLKMASDDPDENPYDIAVSGTGVNSFRLWQETHFAADLGDPAKEATVWGVDANPDGDELSNGGEFFHGLDPFAADVWPVDGRLLMEGGQTFYEVRFPRRKGIEDVSKFYLEMGIMMTDWQSVTPDTVTTTDVSATIETIVLRVLVPAGPRRFYQLVIGVDDSL